MESREPPPTLSALDAFETSRVPARVLTCPGVTIGVALAAGALLDLIAFARPHGPGLALARFVIVAVIGWTIYAFGRLDRESARTLAIGCIFGLVPLGRSSPVLVTLSVLMWLSSLAIGVRRAG